MTTLTPAAPPLLLYDGTCGFCKRSAAFAQRHTGPAAVQFAALASDVGREALLQHGLPADFARSVVFIEHGQAFTESAASWRLAKYLRWPWRTLAAGRLVPPPLRDAVYRWVARNRGQFPGADGACTLSEQEPTVS